MNSSQKCTCELVREHPADISVQKYSAGEAGEHGGAEEDLVEVGDQRSTCRGWKKSRAGAAQHDAGDATHEEGEEEPCRTAKWRLERQLSPHMVADPV